MSFLPFQIISRLAGVAMLLLSMQHCAGAASPRLVGTKGLAIEGDIASLMIEGIDKFLAAQTLEAKSRRDAQWGRTFSSTSQHEKWMEANRQRLKCIVGLRDRRAPFDSPELVGTVAAPALIASTSDFDVFAVRWPAFGDVHGEGLLLEPKNRKAIVNVVALPDCEITPEQLVGLAPGVPDSSQYARRLAASGCRVLVPALISRQLKNGNLPYREWLYRSAFQLGRGLIGYELQKTLACIDWFSKEGDNSRIGVIGWGEGGLLAFYAGAVDPRIHAVAVCGYFDEREKLWREPIDHNLFGLLEEFGDAEIASMYGSRTLVVEASRSPEVRLRGGIGAPASIVTPRLEHVRSEWNRAEGLVGHLRAKPDWKLVVSGPNGQGDYGTELTLSALLAGLSPGAKLSDSAVDFQLHSMLPEISVRHARQAHELDRHNQWLLGESAYARKSWFWDKLNYESVQKYLQSVEPFKQHFATEVIGRFELPPSLANARTRKIDEAETWTRYEVVLDVFPDVIAYGLLTLPKGINDGERRPVVVCQHGLEGRPQDTIGDANRQYYQGFSTRLAELGYITFAPQNPYLFGDRFRSLQRRANPIGKSLFSMIAAQHQQIVDWLQTLPQVDGQRIALYGLSYGGKTAMRVPPLVQGYSLAICSGDFNEWIDKTASTRNPHSYTSTDEYEMFEFNLGNTFGHAEMAALIAPRPFMVERGHFDGVADDTTVGAEYAKVRFLYEARLNRPQLTRIEWFNGPHRINGIGSFQFLSQHLNWPRSADLAPAGPDEMSAAPASTEAPHDPS